MNCKEIINQLKQENPEIIALDTETTSLTDKTLEGFSIAFNNSVYYFPIIDNVVKTVNTNNARELLQYLIDNTTLVMHNSSFDLSVLYKFGINLNKLWTNQIHDTVILANLYNENIQHGLKPLVKKFFNYKMKEYKEICGTGKKQVTFSNAKEIKIQYAKDDAKYTLKLYRFLTEQLQKDKDSWNVYKTIEQPLLPIVAAMHYEGISINVDMVKTIESSYRKKIELAETKLRTLMGNINFNSSKQLREYFIDKLHLPIIKRSVKTNSPSVDKEVLEIYAQYNSEAKLLLEYRKYSKLLGTFIPALTPNNIDIKSCIGKIYTSFNQAGTVSGRFSSSNPNMQNLPRESGKCELCKSELNKIELGWKCPKCKNIELRIRDCVIADTGQILIGADYSQIELRILAHFSNDNNLIKAYKNNKDIHQQTANACGISRYDAKVINFGLVYGMGAKTLAKKINVAPEEAQIYMNKYFNTYSGVKQFWKQAEKQFLKFGYVQTLSGRKRRKSRQFPYKDDYGKSGEIRSAINSIIQGSAADMIKEAMIQMSPKIRQLGARLVSTVHDEVIISSPIETAEEVFQIVKNCMLQSGDKLRVPIDIDIKFGRTWEEAHGKGIELNTVNNK